MSEYNVKAAEKLPYIVVIIDDFSDLILSAGKEFEFLIKRIICFFVVFENLVFCHQ